MIDFSTCLAVDQKHATELEASWPTWRAFCPEIMAAPLHIFCDVESRDGAFWQQRLSFIDHQNCRIWPWVAANAESQREKMLSSLVYLPPVVSETKWFLKIDVDVIRTSPGQWIHDWWFNESPAFVSSPWGYTVPSNAIDTLDRWANGVSGLAHYPPLDIPFNSAERTVRHRRIISWLYFGRTDWHREMLAYLGSRLPLPSQDTVCHYIAERTKQFYRTVKMSRHGWRHINGLHRLQVAAAEALAAHPAHPMRAAPSQGTPQPAGT